MKTTRVLCAAALLAAVAGLGACSPVKSDESAALLVIKAGADFLNAGLPQVRGIHVVITEPAAGTLVDQVYDMIGGWPTDPTSHSVLLIATIPEGSTMRSVAVNVYACDNTQCNASILGSADTTINFRGGDVLNDVTVFINP